MLQPSHRLEYMKTMQTDGFVKNYEVLLKNKNGSEIIALNNSLSFSATKGKFKGTGLGLSMAYGIVKQNNGFIYAYSELEKGTMFKIYWPVTKEEKKSGINICL